MIPVICCLSPNHVTRFNAVVNKLFKKEDINSSFVNKIPYTKITYFTQFIKTTKFKIDSFISTTVTFKQVAAVCSVFIKLGVLVIVIQPLCLGEGIRV
jgi:hypothetical protein